MVTRRGPAAVRTSVSSPMRVRPDPVLVGPAPPLRRRVAESLVVLLVAAAVSATGWLTLRPALLDVGSTASERAAAMPADDTVPAPRTVMTRSVTLSAPPERVWPWLVQMGVGKGGFYGYDWLENLGPAGLLDDIVNADRIHPEWQGLGVGDHVAPMPGSTDWTVTRLEPARLLVITDDHDWTWALMLRPVGVDRTRLVTRMRWAPAAAVAGDVGGLVFDLGDLVIQARALHGLEQRTAGTLPGMPGTPTGEPVPVARLPLGWGAAAAWLAVLAALGAAATRLLVSRRGGWAGVLGVVVVLAWCLWTDTDPWGALGQHWPATALSVVATVLAVIALRRRPAAEPSAAGLGRLSVPEAGRYAVPALTVVGIAAVLPALTVWDAATADDLTTGTPGRLLALALAATAAVATSLPAWAAARARPGVAGLAGAWAAAVVVLVTGSVLAAAVPATAALLALVRVGAPRRPAPRTPAAESARPA